MSDTPSSPSTPSKAAVKRSSSESADTSIPSPKKPKISKSPAKSSKSGTDQWDADSRLKLFEAYQTLAANAVKWTDVAAIMGEGFNAQQCRDQWHRATGKRIKKALSEK